MSLEIDEATMEKAEVLIEEFRNDYFKSKFSPIRHMYIDLEMLQDFRLGALFCLIKTDAEYQYIKHIISKENNAYKTRLNEDTMTWFPAIESITDKDLDEYIENPDNHKRLVVSSPMTTTYLELFDMFVSIIDRNRSVGGPELIVNIGTSSVVYDVVDKGNLVTAFTEKISGFKVFVHDTWMDNIKSNVSNFDMIMAHNISKFIQSDFTQNMFTDEVPLFNGTVVGYPLLEVQTQDEKHAIELLSEIEIYFNTYTNFYYMPRGVII